MPIAVLAILLTLTALQSPASDAPLFLPAASYGTGGYNPLSVLVADVNGDGKPDLIVANQCSGSDFCVGAGAVSVLLSNGDGTFQTPLINASGGSFLNAVAVGDVNADGKPDLIAANGCANIGGGFCSGEGAVGVLMGNGDGTFQEALTLASGGFDNFKSDVAVADVNADGVPDIIVMHGCATPCNPNLPPQGSVSILLGTGRGTFSPAVSYASGGYFANSLVVADLDGNGHLDVVVANWCDDNGHIGDCTTQAPIGVLLGNGDGTFRPAITYGSGGQGGRAVVVADVNADGRPDLLTGNCGPGGCGTFQPGRGVVGVLLGNGDGTFQSAAAYGGGSYVSIAVADVDGDNTPDVLAANMSCAAPGGTGCVDVLVGNGDGSLAAPLPYDAGILPLSIAAADVNGDGAPDAVVAHEFGNGTGIPPGMVDVLLNTRPASRHDAAGDHSLYDAEHLVAAERDHAAGDHIRNDRRHRIRSGPDQRGLFGGGRIRRRPAKGRHHSRRRRPLLCHGAAASLTSRQRQRRPSLYRDGQCKGPCRQQRVERKPRDRSSR